MYVVMLKMHGHKLYNVYFVIFLDTFSRNLKLLILYIELKVIFLIII